MFYGSKVLAYSSVEVHKCRFVWFGSWVVEGSREHQITTALLLSEINL